MLVESPWVPISVRNFAVQIFDTPFIRPLGKKSYELIARMMAKRFSRVPGIIRVLQFGGNIHRCVPGLSDIDFLLICEDLKAAASRIQSVYRAQKRRFLVLGEIHLSTPETWMEYLENPFASRLWFFPQRQWNGSDWVAIPSPVLKNTAVSRFFTAYLHYQKAIYYWTMSLNYPKNYYIRSAQREMAKARVLLVQRPEVVIERGPVICGLAGIACALHSLSETISCEKLSGMAQGEKLNIWNLAMESVVPKLPNSELSQVVGTVRWYATDYVRAEKWFSAAANCPVVPIPISRPMEALLLRENEFHKTERDFLSRFIRISVSSLRKS